MVASLPTMRRLMQASVGVSLLATVGAVGSLWTAPVPPLPVEPQPRVMAAEPEAETPRPQIDLKATYWSKRLQRPTVDSPPVVVAPKPVAQPTAPPKPPPALANVELLGTIVDRDKSFGIFQVAANVVETCKPGDLLPGPNKGAEVVSVTATQAVVKYQGQEFTLKVKAK